MKHNWVLVKVKDEQGNLQILCTSLLDPAKYKLDELAVEAFSGKTATAVKQDIYAKIMMMNLSAALTFPIEEKVVREYREAKKNREVKYRRKINRIYAYAECKLRPARRQKPVEIILSLAMPTFLLLLLLIGTHNQPISSDTPHLAILAFNKLVFRAYKNHDTTAHASYVYGYYIKGRYPMLISNPALVHPNTPLPDSVCVLLRGVGVDSIRTLGLANRYENALVEVYITVKLPPFFPPGMDASKMIHYIYTRPRILKF